MRGITLLTATLPAAMLVSLAFAPTPAIAQSEPSTERLESITVVAPRITRERQRGGRMQVASAEQTAQVEFDDLNLDRTADLFTLEDRVQEAAERVCKELAELYPDGEPSTEVCVRRATDDAMAQVRYTARTRVGMR
ncbi:UrcA family protein [Alkalisalibacterium limincola]|nr:UrcA family protein [Alkalisalibacterium limincola]